MPCVANRFVLPAIGAFVPQTAAHSAATARSAARRVLRRPPRTPPPPFPLPPTLNFFTGLHPGGPGPVLVSLKAIAQHPVFFLQ